MLFVVDVVVKFTYPQNGNPHNQLCGKCSERMSRPRLPSNVLELRGAFKKDPKRRRVDLQGAGLFDANPPSRLSQDCVQAWHAVVERVPPGVLTKTDELAVEIAATLLAAWWLTRDLDVLKEIRQWFAQLGMTPVARTKIPPPPRQPAGNRFVDL
jgi:hypothetical protein